MVRGLASLATLTLLVLLETTAALAQLPVDLNRPRSQFECDTPVGEKWYGSTERCLEELCGGKNVYNEWIFDESKRRRKNPCYGRNPTSFSGD